MPRTQTKYWLEPEGFEEGKERRRWPLAVKNEREALIVARRVYDGVPPEEDHPTLMLVKRDPGDEEDYILIPGGPGDNAEFTWVPREM